MRYEQQHGRPAAALLADDVSVTSVSNECRKAGLAFVNGFRGAWEKLDLVQWLTGPYARATRHVPGGPSERAPGEASGSVPVEPVRELVEAVRTSILEALTPVSYGEGPPSFLDRSVRRGLVRKTVDLDGILVWVPVSKPDLRLVERVESLFAADFLDAPDAYEELVVCRTCSSVVFDDVARRLRQCPAHQIRSGVYERFVPAASRRRGPGLAQARTSSSTSLRAQDGVVH